MTSSTFVLKNQGYRPNRGTGSEAPAVRAGGRCPLRGPGATAMVRMSAAPDLIRGLSGVRAEAPDRVRGCVGLCVSPRHRPGPRGFGVTVGTAGIAREGSRPRPAPGRGKERVAFGTGAHQ